MRYLVCKKNVSNQEIIARMKYIYGLFHIYTSKNSKNLHENITELVSMPSNQLDLLMIVGHDPITNNYIVNNMDNIIENNIIIISCDTWKVRKLKNTKNKKIFLPQRTGKINCYDGTDIGFDFDITDEEITLYRNKNMDFYTMITTALKRME